MSSVTVNVCIDDTLERIVERLMTLSLVVECNEKRSCEVYILTKQLKAVETE